MKIMKKQFNIELPEQFARRIKADAALLGVPLNEYGRIAFQQFISKSAACRRANLDGAKRKTVGRKSEVA